MENVKKTRIEAFIHEIKQEAASTRQLLAAFLSLTNVKLLFSLICFRTNTIPPKNKNVGMIKNK